VVLCIFLVFFDSVARLVSEMTCLELSGTLARLFTVGCVAAAVDSHVTVSAGGD